jgi:hypothetical protein
MALRANRNIATSEMLTTLETECGYRLSNPDELEIFLDHHRALFAPLKQASQAIKAFFPRHIATTIEVSKDYDADDAILDGMLVVDVLLTNVTIDEELELINAFNDKWWAEVANENRAARELVFMTHSDG